MGPNTATGRPRRVMIVERPFSAASRSSGSRLRASSAPLRSVLSFVVMAQPYRTVQISASAAGEARAEGWRDHRAYPDGAPQLALAAAQLAADDCGTFR